IVVMQVVDMPLRLLGAPRDDDPLGAVVHVREREHVVPAEVQEDAEERETDPRREGRSARTIDDARPEHREREAVFLVILPEELLLPELGLRVEIAKRRVPSRGVFSSTTCPRGRSATPYTPNELTSTIFIRRPVFTIASSRFLEATTVFRKMSAGAPESEAARW